MNQLPIGPTETNQLRQSLRQLNFFADVGAADLDSVIQQVKLDSVPAGKALIRQGEAPDTLYIISEGRVAVKTKKWFLAPAKVVKELGAGEVFGEIGLIHSTIRSATVQTLVPSKIFILSRGAFDKVIEQNEPFRLKLSLLSKERAKETAGLNV